jgi:hypothetical protein
MFETSRNCWVLTKVTRQPYDFYTSIYVSQLIKDLQRAITAAVVDEQQLELRRYGRACVQQPPH